LLEYRGLLSRKERPREGHQRDHGQVQTDRRFIIIKEMSDRLKVLLVEDNPGDADLIQEILTRARTFSFDLEWADQFSTRLERLAVGGTDLLLLDLSLPDGRGLDTFAMAHAQAPHVPIIVLTLVDSEALAMKAVREGAQDYLVKGQVDSNLLVRSIRYAIERKRAEEALKKSENKLRSILSSMVDLIFMFDDEGRFIFYHSPSDEELYIGPKQFIGKKHVEVMPPQVNDLFEEALESNKREEVAEYEFFFGGERSTDIQRCMRSNLP